MLSALRAVPASSSNRPCLLLSAKLLICQGDSSQPGMRPNLASGCDRCWSLRQYSMRQYACPHKAQSYCMMPGSASWTFFLAAVHVRKSYIAVDQNVDFKQMSACLIYLTSACLLGKTCKPDILVYRFGRLSKLKLLLAWHGMDTAA